MVCETEKLLIGESINQSSTTTTANSLQRTLFIIRRHDISAQRETARSHKSIFAQLLRNLTCGNSTEYSSKNFHFIKNSVLFERTWVHPLYDTPQCGIGHCTVVSLYRYYSSTRIARRPPKLLPGRLEYCVLSNFSGEEYNATTLLILLHFLFFAIKKKENRIIIQY